MAVRFLLPRLTKAGKSASAAEGSLAFRFFLYLAQFDEEHPAIFGSEKG
jgi:hypothetical protein